VITPKRNGNDDDDGAENRYGITTESKAYARGFDCGWAAGYRTGLWDGYARGWDDASKELAEVHQGIE